MPDPLYGRTYKDGLQVLKNEWCQKAYFGLQSVHLIEHFEGAEKSTRRLAPKRKGGFNLGRTPNTNVVLREALWERAMFERWCNQLSPMKGVWDSLVAYQVPLFADNTADNWGYIDALGINSEGVLSIVELKKEPKASDAGGTTTSESPLRMLLEAASYAIAVQENWEVFRPELEVRLEQLQQPIDLPEKPAFQLVGVAPAAYWIDWLPLTAKGKTVERQTWESFFSLVDKFKDEGFPISFVSLSGDPNNPKTLAAQPLPGLRDLLLES